MLKHILASVKYPVSSDRLNRASPAIFVFASKDTHVRQFLFAVIVLIAAVLVMPALAGAPANRGVRVMPASIPMPAGTVLAATLYMPADLLPHGRGPALRAYLPY